MPQRARHGWGTRLDGVRRFAKIITFLIIVN
jgi:hypothetical protein